MKLRTPVAGGLARKYLLSISYMLLNWSSGSRWCLVADEMYCGIFESVTNASQFYILVKLLKHDDPARPDTETSASVMPRDEMETVAEYSIVSNAEIQRPQVRRAKTLSVGTLVLTLCQSPTSKINYSTFHKTYDAVTFQWNSIRTRNSLCALKVVYQFVVMNRFF
uniref:Uncharacterized protein n=1 Tax=Peronospora matthiolae TaxID=2874970 RepID=A0AAV1UV19_9STRA